MPRPRFSPAESTPVPIVKEAGWALEIREGKRSNSAEGEVL
jgi:hypothetical protein